MPTETTVDADLEVRLLVNGTAREDLIVTGVQIREEFSSISEFAVELIHDNANDEELSPDDLLGVDTTVQIANVKTTTETTTDGQGAVTSTSSSVEETVLRSFHAISTRLQKRYGDPQHERWVMYLASPLWKLTRTSQCRVFLNKKASEIVEAVLDEYGITHDIAATTQTRPYCVQYNESDFQFVSRLLEEEGLFYFFSAGMSNFTEVDGPSEITAANAISAYFDMGEVEVIPESDSLNMIQSWNYECNMPPEKVTAGDFDFIGAANVSREASTTFTSKLGTIYEYQYTGQSMLQAEDYTDYATRRIEAAEAQAEIIAGTSTNPQLAPHNQFTANLDELEVNPTELHTSVVVIAVEHIYDGSKYANTFRCIPSDVVYRPPISTPKPRIYGTQVGVVASADDGVVATDTDNLGRVCVTFPWLEEGAQFWIRVAQAVAGPGFGSWATPRGGQEVIVTFEDGDPDRPLIIGALYNGVNKPPYDLPTDDTKTGIVTRSAPGNDAAKYNELTIDDNDGAEKIFVRAERDLEFQVVNQDFTRTIDLGNEVTTITEGDQTTTLDQGNQETTLTEGNLTLDVGGTLAHTVTGAITIESSESITLKVGGNSIEITTSGVTVTGTEVTIDGSAQTTINGGIVQIN